MPLSVHSTARAHSTASCQASIPCAGKAALIPAHTQITASALDHSILGALHKMLTGFRGREKHFSFCQCKQLARSCSGCVQLKRRGNQDSAPKTYLSWLWEVGMYMPLGLADKECHLFPLTRDNLPSLHHSPLGCKTRLPTGQGSFQSWGQPITPHCWGSGNIS